MTLEARLRAAAEEVQREAATRPIPSRTPGRVTRPRTRIALAAALVVFTVGGTAVVAQQRPDRTRVTTGRAPDGRTTVVLFPAPGASGNLRADRAVIARRLQLLKVSPVTITIGIRSLSITGPARLTSAVSALTRTGELEFRPLLVSLGPPTGRPASPGKQIAAPALTCSSQSRPVRADEEVTAVELDSDGRAAGCYRLGPSALTNPGVITATAQPARTPGATNVVIHFDPTASGRFDEFATANFRRQIAVLADGVVLTTPTVNAINFQGTIIMSGPGKGGFTEAQASAFAAVWASGPLPVPLVDHVIVDS